MGLCVAALDADEAGVVAVGQEYIVRHAAQVAGEAYDDIRLVRPGHARAVTVTEDQAVLFLIEVRLRTGAARRPGCRCADPVEQQFGADARGGGESASPVAGCRSPLNGCCFSRRRRRTTLTESIGTGPSFDGRSGKGQGARSVPYCQLSSVRWRSGGEVKEKAGVVCGCGFELEERYSFCPGCARALRWRRTSRNCRAA